MRLYVIRHADPDYPNNTITPHGHKEAAALAEYLLTLKLTHLFASPMGRAQDTARYTAVATGLPVVTAPWTAELTEMRMAVAPDGRVYEPGVPVMAWDVHGEHVRGRPKPPTRDDWHELTHLADPAFREGVARVARDSDEFLARFGFARDGGRYRITRPHGPADGALPRVAVFCHGGFGLTWLAHLLEIPVSLMWAGFWMPPSSVTTVLLDERSGDWAVPRCLQLGATPHLYKAGLPVQPRGIIANFD